MCTYWAYSDLGESVYAFRTFDKKKEDFHGWNYLRRDFLFILTGSCWPPDSNFTIRKHTSVQWFQILDKKILLTLLVQKSFCVTHSATNLLFSAYFDTVLYSKANQTEERFRVSTFIYFASSRIRSMILERVKNSYRSNSNFTFYFKKYLIMIFCAQT